ncbi:hypothetical protein [Chryseobacterium populi]|uniref:YD repeat-containing protein n=1 Tax=Chryseobacterium populi TaxID=1144316 RepID=J3CGI1_9FLAO|nr:hypothetical protein [Chryseobacterium populi]EJL70926.1 hypothetical protein PMI13_02600 [Chryseobacterium populi]
MKKILSFLTIFSSIIYFGQTNDIGSPYNIIPPSPESYYKSQFGNTDINDFKGEPIVSIPLFSLQNGNIPFELELKYIKAGVKVNDIPNSTGTNWILGTGGIITRTINDIADEKVVHTLIHQLPIITSNNPQDWGAYVIQNNKDHEVDIFNFTVGNYSGSFFLDENFQPVILTKDNNCKVEVIGSFSQNYEFKITTNNGTIYHFGGSGFTEKTFNKEDAGAAGVTSFYLKDISSNGTNGTINFEYESIGTLRSITTDIQESYNSSIVTVEEPPCGGHPLPSSAIEQKNNFLKISDPKRIKKIISGDKTISFDYSDDYVLYNKLNNINVYTNNNLLKKYVLNYLDKSDNNNHLQRYFLTDVKFYENNANVLYLKEDYKLEYDQPLEIPERLSKAIDYLGYYNGQSNAIGTLIPNINLFNETNIPAFDNFADRRPVFEFAKYGSLKSITYPTKGKTVFEYEPITEAPKDDTFWMAIDPVNRTDTKDLFPYEFFGKVQYSFSLRSNDQNINTPALKARAVFKMLDDLNNVAYTSQQITISKVTPNLFASVDGEIMFDRTKKYKLVLEIVDNLCSNCEGFVEVKAKKLDIQNGPGIRLKKQYDITENGTINIKRVYYTDFVNIPDIRKNNNVFIPDFSTYFLLQTNIPNPETSTDCGIWGYTGSSTLVNNIKSTPNLSSLEYSSLSLNPDLPEDGNYLNLIDPMYSNITLSFGGDNFEKGGEEKKYMIKSRPSSEVELFSPSFFDLGNDTNFVGSADNLSRLTRSAKERFHKSLSFPNIDGKLLIDKIFEIQNGNIKYNRIIENKYVFNETVNTYNVVGGDVYQSSNGDPYGIKNKFITSYKVSINEALLDETISTDIPNPSLSDNKIIKKVKNYYSLPNNQLTKQSITNPEGSIVETTYQYANDKNNQKLIAANMIGIPLETSVVEKQNTSDTGKTVSRTETIYPDQNNYPTTPTGSLLLPLSLKSYDLLDPASFNEITYVSYDQKGNLQEYKTKDGISVAIVWGYNETQPIAKIVGTNYRYIMSFISAIVTASDSDAATPANEPALITALDNFRKNASLSAYQITTYTYDPLIGVTSITPPSGIREVYIYDTAGRLQEIRQDSKTGKLLKEFKYNYKN